MGLTPVEDTLDPLERYLGTVVSFAATRATANGSLLDAPGVLVELADAWARLELLRRASASGRDPLDRYTSAMAARAFREIPRRLAPMLGAAGFFGEAPPTPAWSGPPRGPVPPLTLGEVLAHPGAGLSTPTLESPGWEPGTPREEIVRRAAPLIHSQVLDGANLPELLRRFIAPSCLAPMLHTFGSGVAQAAFAPLVARGAGAIAITESAMAGGPPYPAGCQGRITGDQIEITGEKAFVTNAAHAQVFAVLLQTAPELGALGATMVLVPRNASGVEVGPERTSGPDAPWSVARLAMQRVTLPVTHLLGAPGRGLAVLSHGAAAERVLIGVGAAALALRSLVLAGRSPGMLTTHSVQLVECAQEVRFLSDGLAASTESLDDLGAIAKGYVADRALASIDAIADRAEDLAEDPGPLLELRAAARVLPLVGGSRHAMTSVLRARVRALAFQAR